MAIERKCFREHNSIFTRLNIFLRVPGKHSKSFETKINFNNIRSRLSSFGSSLWLFADRIERKIKDRKELSTLFAPTSSQATASIFAWDLIKRSNEGRILISRINNQIHSARSHPHAEGDVNLPSAWASHESKFAVLLHRRFWHSRARGGGKVLDGWEGWREEIIYSSLIVVSSLLKHNKRMDGVEIYRRKKKVFLFALPSHKIWASESFSLPSYQHFHYEGDRLALHIKWRWCRLLFIVRFDFEWKSDSDCYGYLREIWMSAFSALLSCCHCHCCTARSGAVAESSSAKVTCRWSPESSTTQSCCRLSGRPPLDLRTSLLRRIQL